MGGVLLLSARQPTPCAAAAGDVWVGRATENKAEYARAHGLRGFVHTSELLDAEYSGAWNKLVLLLRTLRAELARRRGGGGDVGGGGGGGGGGDGGGGGRGGGGGGGADWLLWVDWEVVFTDLAHELPVDEYEANGWKLVVGGDPKGVFVPAGERADYLKMNSGVMLLKVCSDPDPSPT